jgi:osmotically-inducible protein OsmY
MVRPAVETPVVLLVSIVTVVTALAVSSAGCAGGDTGSSCADPAQLSARDAQTRRSVERALASDPDISIAARNVAVAVSGGVIVLRGCVAMAAQKTWIGVLAEGVPGVTGLSNDLAIDPVRDGDDVESDRTIKDAIFATLDGDPAFAAVTRRTSVVVRHGLVTLAGAVRDDAERAAVVDVASTTPGVVAVDDERGER